MPYGRSNWCSGFFLSYRDSISKRFAALFTSDGTSDKITQKWGWYAIIYQLADGDILKMEHVARILVEEAFTFMAYEKDLNLSQKVKIDADNKRRK